MSSPSDSKYIKDHAWVRHEDNTATVNTTDFARRELSDIVYAEVEAVGDTLPQDTIFGTVEAIKAVSDLFISVSSEVVTSNEPLIRRSEVVNTNPYGEGWIIQMAVGAPEGWNTLLTAEGYRQFIDA